MDRFLTKFRHLVVLIIFLTSGIAQASSSVEGVRSGIYKSGTRFVLDFKEKINYKIIQKKDTKEIKIIFPSINWKLPKKRVFSRGAIISYEFNRVALDKTELLLRTNSKVSISRSFILPPIDYKYFRLVIDLSSINKGKEVKSLNKSYNDNKLVISKIKSPIPLFKPLLKSKPVIVIDPGHGGVDGGAIGLNGSLEKDITLTAALYLKKIINDSGRYKVILTRSSDKYLKLRQRINIARKSKAKLFISIHADSINNSRIRGASVYTLSETASDKEAEKLAKRENKADLIGVGSDLDSEDNDVAQILISLVQRETMNHSLKFASIFINQLKRKEKVLGRPNRKAGFVVLKASDVPSILIEMGFMSNKADERKLQTKKFKSKLASAMLESFDRFFEEVDN
ncbi:MAG: N-acetylmuramoyl-L-alanine amidase [Rhodospirillaceae bacterium]|nr:N-acetylmuramoyl-L-alanine amidase [Rhodospirillaceae bacterium]|tara:strand:+ start:736 stop:1929 length:1194 start_codon:yes stop_codon:yes gene_type:complete